MVPSRVAGGLAQSSSSSGIFFQGGVESQSVRNSQLGSNFGSSSNSLIGYAHSNIGPVSGDASNTVLNGIVTSIPSVGTTSIVTDANSGLPGGPFMQRSVSFNAESSIHLPASPMSHSSNNVSISGSSVMNGSYMVQQSSNQELGLMQPQKNHQLLRGSSSVLQMGQVHLLGGPRIPSSFIRGPTVSQLQNKPHLGIKQEDISQQQALQQLLPSQEPMQLQTLIQKHLLRQYQLLQSLPPFQRAQVLQQQQQQFLLRQQLQHQGMQPASGIKRPYDGGVCSRRLMQYLFHQRQRPAENTITYWRKFVAEYYSPRAKRRWCLSLYDNVGNHSLGVFPPAKMNAWQCDLCGSKSGTGFEATYEVFARLNEIKFSSGVIDELLFLDLPRECRFPSGMMILEYAKAVQESVFEQLRVVREGQLRILFTPDLKILSWDFCARRHEELLPRKLVAPQVTQLLQAAQKCQSMISESGLNGVSQSDIQASSTLVLTAKRQLAKSLELQSLDDLGFSKRYVRYLQIAEVVNSMKDLMDFCSEQKMGPTEGLRNISQRMTSACEQMQKKKDRKPTGGIQGLQTEVQTLTKQMASHPGPNSDTRSNHLHTDGRETLSSSAQAALALNNYQNFLPTHYSANLTQSSFQQDTSSSFGASSQMLSSTIPASSDTLPRTMPNSSISGFSSSHLAPQQLSSGNDLLHQDHLQSSEASESLQECMIHQLLQDTSYKNSGGVLPQSLSMPNNSGGNIYSFVSRISSAAGSGQESIIDQKQTSRSYSFNAAANGESPPFSDPSLGYSQNTSDLPLNGHLQEELVHDIACEFMANGFFDNDLDDNMNFDWKT